MNAECVEQLVGCSKGQASRVSARGFLPLQTSGFTICTRLCFTSTSPCSSAGICQCQIASNTKTAIIGFPLLCLPLKQSHIGNVPLLYPCWCHMKVFIHSTRKPCSSRKIQFKKYVALIIAFSQVYYGNIRDATAFPLLSYVFEFHALLPVYN